jgi:hypothetical protein
MAWKRSSVRSRLAPQSPPPTVSQEVLNFPRNACFSRLARRGEAAIARGVSDVSLKLARERRDELRRELASGVDPSAKRKVERAATADSFGAVAREWFAKFSTNWADTHYDKIIRSLENDIFPWLGSLGQITPPELLACLRRIESRSALDTAHRAHQNCGQIFR